MVLHKFAGTAKKLAEILQPIPVPPQQKRVIPWFKDKGDRTLRLDYDELDNNSLVFDMGGYEGQWTSDIYSKYTCKIYIFEPYKPYAENIKMRFIRNKDIHIFETGLANNTKEVDLSISDDASSVFKESQNKVKIKLERAVDFFAKYNVERVDLMKINIEGGEYDLLEHLIDFKLVERIVNIQVQFHDFVPNAHYRMKKIQENLRETHELTYQYEFVWENWRLKKVST